MSGLQLYARREPTRDPLTVDARLTFGGGRLPSDVVLYEDFGATKERARWPWYYDSRPRRGRKSVTLNCANWALVWLPDLTHAKEA